MAKRLSWANLPSEFSKQQRIWAIAFARKKRKRIKTVLFNLTPKNAGVFVALKHMLNPLVARVYSIGMEVYPPVPLFLPDETGELGIYNGDVIEQLYRDVWDDHLKYWKTPFLYMWGKFRSMATGEERWKQVAAYELTSKKWPGINHDIIKGMEFRDKTHRYLTNCHIEYLRVYTRETWRPRKEGDPTLDEAKKPF